MRVGLRWAHAGLLIAVLAPAVEAQDTGPYDLLFRNARVIDGTGAPWYAADVAVRGGRIVAIGALAHARADRELDVSGLVLSPGFIDMMGQTAAPFLDDQSAGFNLLTQGITTINTGEGSSSAPLGDEDGRRAGWRTMREFLDRLDAEGMPVNVAQNVGHTQIRSIVIGAVDRQATPQELERMRAMVREAMEAGATGLSTSLIYPPAVYASEAEITALAQVAGEYGGRYFTHMRNEGDRLLEAIDEALRIGQAAGTPVHIYHLKAAGVANWPKMRQALTRIAAARAAGHQVAADVYPYVNNGLGIRALIHPRHSAEGPAGLLRKLDDPAARAEIRREMEELGGWENWYAHAGRDWDRVMLGDIEHDAYRAFSGSSVQQVADATGRDAWDVFFDIARVGAFAMPQTMSEANKIAAMQSEFVSFDTDVGPAGRSRIASHPRGYGAFPRVIARYVNDLGALSLEAAVHRMTAAAANEIGAYDRGRIAPGLAADLVVFDPDRSRDRATVGEPTALSEGISVVVVNGEIVLEEGRQTEARPGRVLRGPGWRP